ncbi:hypothetical protein PFICI_03138 [Pestalotiopsis fici W106-1]|uniref:Uncharacterized protein n=1 Tax=Pestalotiopsis fici (strain W106-1 / CGMCC3.15140) TaxID=1229662 RepID=W3XG89_PESFW|nr:uncharacterized protein PFICI_03138 [Pestalotiopsis fici W106-1]ETS85113.1 hypothetical protein PFICI_03138 [Pestalotiopsis fici W106-1]
MLYATQIDGIALVVGSGSGIAREAAFSFAETGAKVAVSADMNKEMAKAASEESKKIMVGQFMQAHAHLTVPDILGDILGSVEEDLELQRDYVK